MKKVKFFDSEYLRDLEEKINKFAETNRIDNVAYSTYKCGYTTYYTCCVTYFVD